APPFLDRRRVPARPAMARPRTRLSPLPALLDRGRRAARAVTAPAVREEYGAIGRPPSAPATPGPPAAEAGFATPLPSPRAGAGRGGADPAGARASGAQSDGIAGERRSAHARP